VRVVSARSTVTHRFGELWRNRELLGNLTRSDIKVKYKNSALGVLWSMVAPLVQLGIYWLVFGVILDNHIPNYVVFLFAGLIVWNFFFGSVTSATGIIVERAGIVKKVSFPREILSLSCVGAQIFYFAMQAIAFAVVMLILSTSPDWSVIWLLIPAMAALLVLASAFSVLLSAVNVKLRDTKHLVEIALQLWFWLTPIVYWYEKIAAKLAANFGVLKWLYLMNPVTPIVLTFQRIFYPHVQVVSTIKLPGGTPRTTLNSGIITLLPTWSPATYAMLDCAVLAAALAVLYFAIWVFGRLEGNFAEEL